MLTLYMVAHVDDDGDNQDLLVWAASRRQSVKIWQAYFQHDTEGEGQEPHDVFVVPTAMPTTPGALEWWKDVKEAPEEDPLIAATAEALAQGEEA